MSKSGLGKGFGSLLPNNFDESILLDKKDRTQKLFIKDISPNPEQPRRHFDQSALKELSVSVKRHGILQPLVVTPNDEGTYTIIAGERRYRAAKLAGLKEVPALVRSSEELDRLEIGLVENVQRVDLSPLEQAVSIAKLNEQFNIPLEEIAKRLGKAHTTVVNSVRLLQLPDSAKKALTDGEISEGHARSILALKDLPAKQQQLLDLIIKNKLSVRQAEQFVKEAKGKKQPTPTEKASTKEDIKISEKLEKKLSTKVMIQRGKKGGRLQVYFGSDEELENIVSKIG